MGPAALAVFLLMFLLFRVVLARPPERPGEADPEKIAQLERELSVPMSEVIRRAEEAALPKVPTPDLLEARKRTLGGLYGVAATFTGGGGAVPGSISVTYVVSDGSYEDGVRKGQARIREIRRAFPIGGLDDTAEDS
jgi:hypothetical protein